MADHVTTSPIDAILATARDWGSPPAPDVYGPLQNLIQAYALFTDEGRSDELRELFTPDATWDGTDLGYGTAEGPDAIVETVLGHHDPARPMVHVPGPLLLVEVAADEVQGASWCLAARSTGPLIFFHYLDGFRREPDGRWRFARRRLRLTARR
jgi:hypothetical protein